MPEIRKTDIKYIVRLFLFIFIPIAILNIGSVHLRYHTEFTQTQDLFRQDQEQYLNSVERFIDLQYEELYQDLFVLINATEMIDYTTLQIPENQQGIELLFLRIAQSKTSFDQIRFLDETGQELVRVNKGENKPILVSADGLQNKQSRYYFQKTSRLKKNEIYVSDMDLNMEHQEVEVPYKPMIRVATPLFDTEDTFIGIAIINYIADDILTVFEQKYEEHNEFRLHLHVLNNEGYYLSHPDPEITFGFMLEGREDNNLPKEDPALWAAIQANDHGVYQHANQIYTFHQITPGVTTEKLVVNQRPWIIMAHTDLTQVPLIANQVILGMEKGDFVQLFGLALFAMTISIFAYYLKRDKSQMLIASKIAANTQDAVLVTNHNNRILTVNEAFERITGFKEEEVIGQSPSIFKSGKQSPDFYAEMWRTLNDSGEWEGELWDLKKDGSFYPKSLKITAIRERYTKRTTMYIGIFTDLTFLRREQAMTKHLQYHERDTQLPNEALLKQLLKSDLENRESDLFLVCFRILNHTALYTKKTESRQLRQAFLSRIRMTLNPKDIIAQTGRNQFVLLCSSINDKTDMDAYLKRFFTLCKQPIVLNGETFTLKVNAGIAAYPRDANHSRDLLVNGYLAMKNAIRQPNTDYQYFTPEIKEDLDHTFSIETNLKAALENREFHLVYQPQIDLRSNQVIGAEALIRWNHPSLGMISPAVFIPIAERIGFIVSLGYWIIETTFRELSEIHLELPEEFRLSINLSVLQFNDRNLLDFILQTGETYHINFKQIEIEITETVLMSDIDAVHQTLEAFQRIGISVAIDDFGTGFSSLSYLSKLPINKLKVDRTFIRYYPETDDGKMASIIADLARTLELKLLMEGAETKEQIEFLSTIGYDYVQGFYYAKPLKKDDLLTYLSQPRLPEIE